MSSWYTPERYADGPGSSSSEYNTAIREALLWQHVFLGGLGCGTTFMVDIVFGTAKKGEPLPILLRWDFCPTLIAPGLVAKPSLAVWHETAPCFLDGIVSTVTKIAIHGRNPLDRVGLAKPSGGATTHSTTAPPNLQCAIKLPGVQPVKRRIMLFNACCRS
ncbi:unnamed protein product [Ectocarpus sp. CCAP 1310/34]|nr:unnamed protein product [Ectocarpus sp. CCAP 1310/34]